MVGTVLDLKDLLVEDQLGCYIAQSWITWNTGRRETVDRWNEIRKYIFAVDTTKTTNAKLPWKNKTTIPKLCQIRDNLATNYTASLFPKRDWLVWEPDDEVSSETDKKEAIEAYSRWFISQPVFKQELTKCILDYIDYGNAFATVEWVDNSHYEGFQQKVGYTGPAIRRISPLDIVFNPISPSFEDAPKIIRSWVSLGEVKEIIERESGDKTVAKEIFDYLKGIRQNVYGYTGEIADLNDYYQVDGFSSYALYLQGDYCELLTYYGDYYDYETGEFYRDQVVSVVDRHKVIHKAPNPSYFGKAPIYHVGWRVRQDNLWAMGPLENLVGMQYRIDHIENLKADVFDLITFPPLKIKGNVEDFNWGPFERIYCGDEGDVEMMAPPFQVLTANSEIDVLEQRMEQMAGAPKEALGIRTPGEKTKYEVQQIENGWGRVFANKIGQFEEYFVEPLINAQLELGRRNIQSSEIRVFDDELKFTTFTTLTPQDITGNGRIRPIAARHFAEKADKVQNVNAFFQSALGNDPDIKAHFSSVKLAYLFEDLLELRGHDIVQPYVRLSEQAEAQKQAQVLQEQTMVEGMTPDGLSNDDFEGQDISQAADQFGQG